MKKNDEKINENIKVLPTNKIDSAAWRELPYAEEGHVGKYKNKIKTIYDIVQKYQPKVSAQTGLNAGHSAILILEASDTVLHSFDLGHHLNSTPLVHGILEKYYPNRHYYVEGDSKKTLKNFDTKIDFAMVDGGHDYDSCLQDIINFDRCLNLNGLMLIDDVHQGPVGNAVNDFNWELYDDISEEVKDYHGLAKLFIKKRTEHRFPIISSDVV